MALREHVDSLWATILIPCGRGWNEVSPGRGGFLPIVSLQLPRRRAKLTRRSGAWAPRGDRGYQVTWATPDNRRKTAAPGPGLMPSTPFIHSCRLCLSPRQGPRVTWQSAWSKMDSFPALVILSRANGERIHYSLWWLTLKIIAMFAEHPPCPKSCAGQGLLS